MYVQFKTWALIMAMGLALLFSGQPVLAETPAPKADETILLLLGKEQDLTGCKLLGKVTAESEDDGATYPERMFEARDKLRAETAKLGGNAVHVLQTYNTARYAIPGIEQKIKFSGNAYFCE